jgi:hypothetical protein
MTGNTTSSRAWKWIGGGALALVALALLLAAFVAFVVPGIVRTQAAKGMEEATGRKLAIGSVSIHPFTWKVEVKDLSLSEVGGKGTFASFQRLQASVSPASVLRGAPVISQVRLEGPHFNVIRTAPNTYNFADLVKYLTLPVPELSLEDVAITGGSIDFVDRALSPEEKHTVRDAQLMVPFLTTVPARAAEYGNPRFSALIDGAPLSIETKVRGLPRAPEVSAQVDLKNLSLPIYLSYLPAEIPVKVDSGKLAILGTASYRITPEAGAEIGWDGAVTVTGIRVSEHQGPFRMDVSDVAFRSRVTSGQKRGMIVEDGVLEIRNLAVPFGDREGMVLGLLSVTGARFSEQRGQVEVAEVLFSDGKIRISRDRKGVFSPQPLLEHLQSKLPTRHAAPDAKPIQYAVKSFEMKGIDLTFVDGTRKELPSFAFSGVNLQAKDITGPLAGPVKFAFGGRFGKDALFRATGTVVPTPLSADVDLEVKRFSLAVADPYVPDDAEVVIAGGLLDLKAQLALVTRKDQLTGTFGGGASVRSLKLLDRRKEKLVAWEELSVAGVKGNVEPMTLDVAKVGLTGLRVDLVLDADGNSNLPRAKKAPPGEPGKGAPAKRGNASGFKSIRIDEFLLKDGAVNLTDRSVPGDFHATVKDISARVTGISTEPGKFADVRAKATFPKGAPLLVQGKAAPLKSPAFADLELQLEGLDLTTATPYAGTYLGLEVDKGALTVKSRARVDQGKLAAENRIRVDQLTFGKAVKSDKATFLPVRMLVDILRDRNGDIVLDLPVAASTDDEDVAGTIVGQVVKNVIFPPRSPLRNVVFAACSVALTPDAQDRLRTLAGALKDRPAMKVIAFGYVDREVDGKACQAAIVAVEKGAPPPLEGEARLEQLAEGRADAVRDFLVLQGTLEPGRVSASTDDIYASPKQKGEQQARVEFARGTD